MIVSRLNGKWAFAVQLFVRWTVAIMVWEILKIMLWKHLTPMDAFAARESKEQVWSVYRNLLLLPIVSMWPRKSVGKFSIDGKLVELGLGIPSMETFPRLSPGDSFPRWKICWVRLDIPSMEIFLNRWNLHRWIYIYIYKEPEILLSEIKLFHRWKYIYIYIYVPSMEIFLSWSKYSIDGNIS